MLAVTSRKVEGRSGRRVYKMLLSRFLRPIEYRLDLLKTEQRPFVDHKVRQISACEPLFPGDSFDSLQNRNSMHLLPAIAGTLPLVTASVALPLQSRYLVYNLASIVTRMILHP